MRKGVSENEHEAQLAVNLAYAHGYIKATLDDFAKSFGISTEELASRMGSLLLNEESGKVLGIENTMPALRSNGAKRSKTTRSVEVARRTYKHRAQKTKKRLDWWWELSQKQRDEITAKRVKSNKKARAEKEAA